ncbi:C13 family peptidase [Undibacterium sp.]|uniref:C13 family peptidase n=1 Tax=Undibacterium sp. TaxID=1914977 RepID=UPI0025E2648A|nr:C13 family peptidase [Undibacterium sp.]
MDVSLSSVNTSPLSSASAVSVLFAHLKAGLAGALFLRIDPEKKNANWSQLILLTLLSLVLKFGRDFLEVGIHGHPSWYGLPGALFALPLLIVAAWALCRLARQPEKTLSILILLSSISLYYQIFQYMLSWGLEGKIFPAAVSQWLHRSDEILLFLLALACATAACRVLQIAGLKRIAALFLTVAIIAFPLSHIYLDQSLWVAAYDSEASAKWDAQHRILESEDVFYLQPQLLERALAALQPSQLAGIQVFFVGVAGYSDQDVFMKEVDYVSALFKRRYATTGHTISLINNPKSASTVPIASATSLQMALQRVGDVMQKDQDVLFLYLSSHGSKEHRFSLNFGSMRFNHLDPKRLREMLDKSGIKRRVIVISACYSGGFIDALKDENTLVMSSAAFDKTSFGCSNEADFTYFGKAYFEQALQKTDSFIDAFELAKPVIAKRERAEDFTESEPQIFVGKNIRSTITELTQQLAAQRLVKVLTDPAALASPPSLPKQTQIQIQQASAGSGLAPEPELERKQAALQLVASMRLANIIDDSVRQCKESAKSRSAESIVKSTPDYFMGLTPQSTTWPEVTTAYQAYFDLACNYFQGDQYTNAMASVFVHQLSLGELQELNRFYASALGSKFSNSNLAANQALQTELSNSMVLVGEQANTQFTKKLTELAAIEHQAKLTAAAKIRPWWRFW